MRLVVISDNVYSASYGSNGVPDGARPGNDAGSADDPESPSNSGSFLALGYFYMHEFFPLLRPRFRSIVMAGPGRVPAVGENWTNVPAGSWLEFRALPDFRGIAEWVIRAPGIAQALYRVIRDADVILLKIFSLNAILALPIARFLGKRIMCQIVGDPVDAFSARARSWPRALRYPGKLLIGWSARSIVAASSLVWTVSEGPGVSVCDEGEALHRRQRVEDEARGLP